MHPRLRSLLERKGLDRQDFTRSSLVILTGSQWDETIAGPVDQIEGVIQGIPELNEIEVSRCPAAPVPLPDPRAADEMRRRLDLQLKPKVQGDR